MFQHGALFSSLTLAENVAVPLRAWTELADDTIADIANWCWIRTYRWSSGDTRTVSCAGE